VLGDNSTVGVTAAFQTAKQNLLALRFCCPVLITIIADLYKARHRSTFQDKHCRQFVGASVHHVNASVYESSSIIAIQRHCHLAMFTIRAVTVERDWPRTQKVTHNDPTVSQNISDDILVS
jgi:hypothetical protein